MVESPLNKSSSCGDIFLRREKLAWEALKTIFNIILFLDLHVVISQLKDKLGSLSNLIE